MNDIATAVSQALSQLVPDAGPPAQIAPDIRLAEDLGVTSMQMVLLITTLCQKLGVSISAFDESDLTAMTTPHAIATMFEAQRYTKAN